MKNQLNSLPTETLMSLASLTSRLRAEQQLRALATSTLKEMLLLAQRNNNQDVEAVIRTELNGRPFVPFEQR